jgi:hypothetical protein
VVDDELQTQISKLADDYELTEGECFTKPMAMKDREKKSPRKYKCFFSLFLIYFVSMLQLLRLMVALCCCSSLVECIWWPCL